MEQLSVGENVPPINLTQALKRLNWVMHGGEAKAFIAEGMVRVNGEAEHRKRRKLNVGDVVEMDGGLQAAIVE